MMSPLLAIDFALESATSELKTSYNDENKLDSKESKPMMATITAEPENGEISNSSTKQPLSKQPPPLPKRDHDNQQKQPENGQTQNKEEISKTTTSKKSSDLDENELISKPKKRINS